MPKSRRAAAMVIVNPAITSINDITVSNKNVESPFPPMLHGKTIHETRNATNTNVDNVWSIIEILEVRVDLNISI